MKKQNKTLILVIVLFAVDFLLTAYFINTSSHVDEKNPLINYKGGYIILGINVLYFIIIYLLTIIVNKHKTIYIKSKTTKEYVKGLFQSEHINFIFISLMFAFIYASIVSRIITILEWVVYGFLKANFFNSTYGKIRALMPFGRFDLIISILTIFIFTPLWYYLEFKKNLNEKAT